MLSMDNQDYLSTNAEESTDKLNNYYQLIVKVQGQKKTSFHSSFMQETQTS